MLDAFDILFNLETKLRIFIHTIMTERFGHSWYKQRVPGELCKDWQKKRIIALSKKEKEYPLLWYADFTDYIKIIEQNHNWNDVFRPVFQTKIDIQTSFQRLFPIRICIAHQRPITKEDFLLLTVESHRILRAIDELSAGGNPPDTTT
ncbi:MAG: Swt1 family HEPN domain-containing protein [Candidatus Entotheonellia bacterium]